MSVSPWPLEATGPAQYDFLVHFCGPLWGATPTPYVPSPIRRQYPWGRLANILWEQRLNGYAPFRARYDQPMVCLSECPLDHWKWLLRDRGWPPWGLIFTRQLIYDLGGGPAWHVRQQEYGALQEDQFRWAVRFDTTPPRSDWLHEREWRVPVPAHNPALILGPGMVVAILVGDPQWAPTRFVETDQSPNSPSQWVPRLPQLWTTARVWWNAAEQRLEPVDPVPPVAN